MAQKLNITRSAYSRFERSEQAGCLSLKSIKEIAEAMDCELIYAIRPKRKIKFSLVIWQRLIPKAIEHSWYKTRLKQVKPQALAAVAKWMTEKSI
jgi:transcriptional regulator with XRE-family HTH domain